MPCLSTSASRQIRSHFGSRLKMQFVGGGTPPPQRAWGGRREPTDPHARRFARRRTVPPGLTSATFFVYCYTASWDLDDMGLWTGAVGVAGCRRH